MGIQLAIDGDTLLAIFPESSVWAFIVFSAGMI